jgi:hypothetical protein
MKVGETTKLADREMYEVSSCETVKEPKVCYGGVFRLLQQVEHGQKRSFHHTGIV